MARPVKLGWGVRREGRSLWTRNAVRGASVRGERRKKDGRVEWRQWIPSKSKVAAALLRTNNDPTDILPEPSSTSLYLGASSGGVFQKNVYTSRFVRVMGHCVFRGYVCF